MLKAGVRQRRPVSFEPVAVSATGRRGSCRIQPGGRQHLLVESRGLFSDLRLGETPAGQMKNETIGELVLGGVALVGFGLALKSVVNEDWQHYLLYGTPILVGGWVLGRLWTFAWHGGHVAAESSLPSAPGSLAHNGDAVKSLLVELHRRWFPGVNEHRDPDYRLTLWVPHPNSRQPTEWRCLAYSDDRKPAPTSWPVVEGAAELETAGAIVATASSGVEITVDGIPGQAQEGEERKARYRKESYVSREQWEKRSWKWATLQTKLVRTGGPISSILMVERQSGADIAPDDGDWTPRFDLSIQTVLQTWFHLTTDGNS